MTVFDFLKTFPQAVDLVSDSRLVKPGDIFVALIGSQTDGRNYLAAAAERGAIGFIVEGTSISESKTITLPIFFVPDLKQQIGALSAHFYGHPARHLHLYGVTGTNGKTSTTHLIAQLLQSRNKLCAVLGTLGVGFPPDELESFGLTTPDILTLQRYFNTLRQQGAAHLAMEVSSHALTQARVAGLTFESVVLTNVTQDHLDYHDTMAEYWAAKRQLLTNYSAKHVIVNVDDSHGYQFCRDWAGGRILLPSDTIVVGYGLSFQAWDTLPGVQSLFLNDIERSASEVSGRCVSPWGTGRLVTRLLGDFNLSNLLAAIAVVCLSGQDFEGTLACLPQCESVAGRMTRVGGGKGQPLVVVDYAHTPDALGKALQALRPYCRGVLSCVFGCGGDRDRLKRPLMLAQAEAYADRIWITQDNSRTEPSEQIIKDILQGQKNHEKITVELDRYRAIELALGQAGPQDIVLVAGKGHETQQILGTTAFPFSDRQVIETILSSKE